MKTNFWTVLKSIDDIHVNEETKKQINLLRTKHHILMEQAKKYEPTVRNNVVTVTMEQVDKSYELWGEAEKIRDEIEFIITANSKKFSEEEK